MTITIIIATYNAEKTLNRCLNSIIPQLNEECEVVIIDGNSKDKTNEIIKSYKESIAYSISEPDKGIYDAWNKGIKVAKGKWVAFIGADDILLPNALQEYLSFIKKTPNIDSYDYICAQNEYVDMNGKLVKIIGDSPSWNRFRISMNAAHVASLHNKQNLFDKIGEYDLSFKICADYELLMRKKQNLKHLFIPAHIARMQIGGMSFSTAAIIETYKIRKKHHSCNKLFNYIFLLKDYLSFKTFTIRKSIKL